MNKYKNRDSDHFSRNIDISTFEKNGRCPYFKGLTFVELFVVVALFSLLSLAAYAVFASGLRMYKRVNEITLQKRKAILGLERFSQEMRQVLNFTEIGLTGKSREITFAVLVNDEINKVTYIFEEGALIRKQENFKDILEEKEQVKSKAVIPDVGDLKLNFAYKEAGKEKFSWKDTWNQQEEGMPLAVKLELKTKDNETFVRTAGIQIVQ